MIYFLHIPKTAGTSFAKALERSGGPGRTLMLYGKGITSPDTRTRVAAMSPQERRNLRHVAGHQVWFGIHELFEDEDPTYVTFLRSPASRVISDYHKIRRTPSNEFHRRIVEEGATLLDFARGMVSPFVRNQMTVFLGRDHVDDGHNSFQNTPWSDDLLAVAFRNLATCRFIGFQESYARDLARLEKLTGLPLEERHDNRPPSRGEPLLPPGMELEILRIIAENNRMDALCHDWARALSESGEDPA